jgi:2-polyprenyl-3-methyl-5-hydroxy-6-metoxy-1,4-benzoquinol methylase
MTPLDRFIQWWRFRVAREWIPQGASVLDVGSSDGAFFRHVTAKAKVFVGIDPHVAAPCSGTALKLIRGVFPEDLGTEEPYFDVITLLAVLEHIPPERKDAVAKACHRLLRERGRVVITVPSPFVDHILSILKAMKLIHGMSLEEHHGFRIRDVIPLFRHAGFNLLRHRRFQLGLNNLFIFERSD